MDKKNFRVPVFYLMALAFSGWFALVSQLYLIIVNRLTSLSETIIRYFSFFTILTNIIVAVCVTVLLVRPRSKWGVFFSDPGTLTAVTVYITIVGVVYNLILRFLWQPQGLQYITDELLHTIIPTLFVLLWILYVPKTGLKYGNAFKWLAYPLLYIIYIAVRGMMTGYYPYPFIDVVQLGYSKVLLNCGWLLAAFLGLSLLLIAIGRLMTGKKRTIMFH